MPTYTIHIAQITDHAGILMLLRHVNLLTDDILTAGSGYWIAKTDNDGIAGCIGLEFGNEAVLLRSMAVYEAHRGRGLARRLIEHSLSTAKATGYHHVYCFSTRAADYFQRIGFTQVPVVQLAEALPDAPQVRRFAAIGKLAGERAWHKAL